MFQPGTVVAHLFHYSFFFFYWIGLSVIFEYNYISLCVYFCLIRRKALFSALFLFPFLFCIVLLLANNKNNIKRSHYRVL